MSELSAGPGDLLQTIDAAVAGALADRRLQALLTGSLDWAQVQGFFRRFIATHLNSVHVLSFLLSLAPHDGAGFLRENLLEELGLAGGDEPHPDLLLELGRGLGFSEGQLEQLRAEAEEAKRRFVGAPMNGRTIREVGLEVLLETVAFESLLSKLSDPLAGALISHYGVPAGSVRWLRLHGEVDIRHAAEGRRVIAQLVAFHRFTTEEVAAATRTVFASNPCLERYFGRASPLGDPPGSAAIQQVTIFALSIPFQHVFAHALATRGRSDAVVVEVRGDDGATGYGEALPRPYVTGETVDSMLDVLRLSLAPRVLGLELDAGERAVDQVAAFVAAGREQLPRKDRVVAWNACLCALELALLDLAFRRAGLSMGQWLAPVRGQVVYSGVIDAADPDVAGALARRYRQAGMEEIKVKVGTGDDLRRLELVRAELGDGARLRVDANGAWADGPTAVKALAPLLPIGLEAIEQPVPAPDLAGLLFVRQQLGIPVIADESLVTLADARHLIDRGSCDIFNVRISKCGGLLASRAIARLGLEAGLAVAVGAQVGETSLLSAAGRLLAAHLPRLAHAEGSFGAHLLAEDITSEPVMFGFEGRGGVLAGPGLGVAVEPDRLGRLAAERIVVGR